jgi:hypothetical protein
MRTATSTCRLERMLASPVLVEDIDMKGWDVQRYCD